MRKFLRKYDNPASMLECQSFFIPTPPHCSACPPHHKLGVVVIRIWYTPTLSYFIFTFSLEILDFIIKLFQAKLIIAFASRGKSVKTSEFVYIFKDRCMKNNSFPSCCWRKQEIWLIKTEIKGPKVNLVHYSKINVCV